MAAPAPGGPDAQSPQTPGRDCPLCPRLVGYREDLRAKRPEWHNAPVPPFGPVGSPLLVVGLAPGVGGANATGRAFTGDFAGAVLYPALIRHGFAEGEFRADPCDGLRLTWCRIVNAVRCVPPQNKPTTPEIRACAGFLSGELAGVPEGGAILALGRIAHESVVRTLGLKQKEHPFRHGGLLEPSGLPALAASYHTSRYNVNTGVLTEAMFDTVVARLAARLLPGRA